MYGLFNFHDNAVHIQTAYHHIKLSEWQNLYNLFMTFRDRFQKISADMRITTAAFSILQQVVSMIAVCHKVISRIDHVQKFDRMFSCSIIIRKQEQENMWSICLSDDCYFATLKFDNIRNAHLRRLTMIINEEITKICELVCKSKDKNINGFSIIFEAKNNMDYEKKLKENLDDFVKKINKLAFSQEDKLIVEDICEKVKEAFEKAKVNDVKGAREIVKVLLENYNKNEFAVSDLDRSYAFRAIAPFKALRQRNVSEEECENMMDGDLNFFRARQIGKDKIIRKKEEINYLSYNNREKAGDMRFSSKGKICLYLGTTSYVCSRECRWDGKKNLYMASYKFNEKGKKLKILNLVVTVALINGMIPREEDNSECRELYNEMIKVFPLALATMFTIHTSDDERKEKCKYEYLLSQIIMDVISEAGIDGVAYLSRQGKDDFQYPQMVCLAIPVKDINQNRPYGKLINNFTMTLPFLYNKFVKRSINDVDFGKGSYINEKYCKYTNDLKTENYFAKVDYQGKNVFYQDIEWSKFDDYLVNQIHTKFVSALS